MVADLGRLYECQDSPPKGGFDVWKALRGPIQFKWYLYITITHLIFVELGFVVLTATFPFVQPYLQFINYAYICIVALHGAHWAEKRLKWIPSFMLKLKPYIDALDEKKEDLGLSPEEFVALLHTLKDLAGGSPEAKGAVKAPPKPGAGEKT